MLARAPAGSVVSSCFPIGTKRRQSIWLPRWPEWGEPDSSLDARPRVALHSDDVQSRLIFVPSSLRQQDYVEMMSRVTAQLGSPPQVVVLRGHAGHHTPYDP